MPPKLRYEPEPHKDTLGYWVQPQDWAQWEFDSPGAGEFEVQLLQGCGTGSGGAEIEILVAGQTLSTRSKRPVISSVSSRGPSAR